ncbi:hypothetical protein [Rhodanobacter sp. DHB23]|uniref:hypothetical protein n=1 Tax=Rhodanobacter sp. DHB23 TaxID=2775923 RepID=UPI0021060853|nr:hypothetical protein [Rhodanobacter sp. DHB23]
MNEMLAILADDGDASTEKLWPVLRLNFRELCIMLQQRRMCPKQALVANRKAKSCPRELMKDAIPFIVLKRQPYENLVYAHAADADAYLQGQQSLGSGHKLFLSGDLLRWCHRANLNSIAN